MSSSDINNNCRTCLSVSNFYHQLYDCVEENYKILEMLDAIVPQIDYKTCNIQCSTVICDNCVEKLLIAYKFQHLCIESNTRLQDLLGFNVFEVTEPKLETIDDPLTEVESFEMKEEPNVEEFKNEVITEEVLQVEESKSDVDRELDEDDEGGVPESDTDSSHEQLLILKESSLKNQTKTSKQNHVKTSYPCSKCFKVLSSIKRLKRHLDKHEKQLKFLCEICSLGFSTKKLLKTHMLNHKNKDKSLKDLEPKEKFNNEYNSCELKDNEDVKEAKDNEELQKFPCPQCDKEFEKKNSLLSHIKVHKKKEEWGNCSTNEYGNKEAANYSKINKERVKTTPVSKEYKDDNEDKDADFFSSDNEETNTDSDGHMLSKTPIKETEIVVDYIDTGVGEIEKPNLNNKRKGYFPCELCGKVYDRCSTLKRHTIVHSAERPYECKSCTYRFASLNGLKTHEHLHKQNSDSSKKSPTNPEGFKCNYCPRRFEKKSSLTAHQHIHTRKHNEINYPCMHCEEKFQLIKTLTEHIANKHPEIEKHKCDQCDKTFVLHAHLVEHLNRHKGNLNLVCIICEKEFSYNNILLEHMRTHTGDSPYLCNQCGKSFRSFTTLHMHLERHANLKKYQCPECPSRFNCRSDVLKHSSVHSKVKPHVCDICGTGFSRRYSLRHHKIIHTGERKFKCEECGVSFVTNNQLQRHMRIHTGERPFKCKYCERNYASVGDLKKHLRSHLGKNTYICDECPMAFKYKAELREHKSEHFKMAQKLAKDTVEQQQQIVQKEGLQEQQIEMQI